MSDVFRGFLTPQPPLIPYCPISAHTPILWCPILTLSHPPIDFMYKDMFFLSQKCQLKFGCKVNIKIHIMSKRKCTLGKIRFSKKKIIKKIEKRLWKLWDVLFLLNYLPPLSYFVRFCWTPQPPLKSDIIYVRSLTLLFNQEETIQCIS